MLTLEYAALVSKPPAKPAFSPWGYAITEDGSTSAMTHQWWHGVIIALLYPDLLAAYKIDPPQEHYTDEGEPYIVDRLVIPDTSDEVDVFAFQAFEHSVHGQLPIIRVCPTRMLGPSSVDLPPKKCTTAQVDALRLVFKECNLKARDTVCTDYRDMSVRECLEFAQTERVE